MKHRLLTILFILSLLISIFSFSTIFSAAEDQIAYLSEEESGSTGNLTLANGVTKEMCKSSYWKKLSLGDKDEILMTHAEIDSWNRTVEAGSGTGTSELSAYTKTTTNAANNRDTLMHYNPFAYRTDKQNVYINGRLLNKNEYIEETVLPAIGSTAYTETSRPYQYAVAVRRTAVKALPIPYEMGWSATDPDDENQISVLDVNDPVIITQKCDFDGHTFYYCQADHIAGWIDSNDLALFKTKDEWISAWKVDSTAEDFLVVMQNKIVLEKSHMNTATSEVKLYLGTRLKLVPEEDIPDSVDERGTWNNYVVYLPTRDEDGYCIMKMALISQHYDVSIGYPDLTQANILDVCFSCLGDRYGWGGSDDAMDCTLYTRLVYKVFGFKMPRNTTSQTNTATGVISMSGMTEDEKEKLIETSPAGACIYWADHAVIYTGTVNGINYAINNVGTVCDSTGDISVKQMYNVILNPLTVRRANGSTWLSNQNNLLLPAGKTDISDADMSFSNDDVTVEYEGKTLYEGINYTVSKSEGIYTISGINNFKGVKAKEHTQKITGVSETYRKAYGSTFTLSPTAKTALSYKSSNTNVATVSPSGKVTIKGIGKARISIIAEGTNEYTSAVKTVTVKGVPKKPSTSSLTTGKNSLTVKMKTEVSKTKGTRYQIYYRAKGSSSWKTKVTQNQSTTLKNLKKGNRYQVKVRAYRTVNNVRYYGCFSDIKTSDTI